MAKLSIVNLNNGDVVYSGNTRKRKWNAIVQDGVKIIKGLDANIGSSVIPQGVVSFTEKNKVPPYAKGSGLWLLSRGGKYQLILEE